VKSTKVSQPKLMKSTYSYYPLATTTIASSTATSCDSYQKSNSLNLLFYLILFTKYSLYPWILYYLHTKTSLSSWSQCVLGYGLLLSTLQFGEYLGKAILTYYSQTNKLSNTFYKLNFLGLLGSYFTITMISRYTLMLGMFFLVGFTGSILQGFTLKIDSRFPLQGITFQRNTKTKNSRRKLSSRLSSLTTTTTAAETTTIDSRETLERKILCFSFFSLIVGFSYNAQLNSSFPLFSLSFLLFFVCTCMLLYYFFILFLSSCQWWKGWIPSSLSSSSSGKIKLTSVSSSSLPPLTDDSSQGGLGGLGPGGEIRIVSRNAIDEIPDSEINYHGKVPVNFMNNCSGNFEKARLMYGKMLKWRELNQVDQIFDLPQLGFDLITENYPHYIHGYSLDGCAIAYEVLGKGKVGPLIASGITVDDLVWHFNLRNEVIFRYVLDPQRLAEAAKAAPPGVITPTPFESPYNNNPDVVPMHIPRMMTILDLDGVSIFSFTPDVLSFMSKGGFMVDHFYPEQVKRLIVINTPMFFSSIWRVLTGVLPASVINKVDFVSDLKELDKYIHPSQRPLEYLGDKQLSQKLGEFDGHRYFLSLPERWNHHQQHHQQQPIPLPGSQNVTIGGSMKSDLGKSKRDELRVQTNDLQSVENSRASTDISMNAKVVTGGGGGKSLKASSSGGVIGWLKALRTPKSTPSEAYLGEKNSFHFNAITGKWEIDFQQQQEEEERKRNNDQDEVNSLLRSVALSSSEDERSNDEETGKNKGFKLKRENSTDSKHKKTVMKGSNNNINKSPMKRQSSMDSISKSSRATTEEHATTPLAAPFNRSRSQDELDDHNLVIAIQAAHLASSLNQRKGKTTTGGGDDGTTIAVPMSISSNQVLVRREDGILTASSIPLNESSIELGIGRNEPIIRDEEISPEKSRYLDDSLSEISENEETSFLSSSQSSHHGYQRLSSSNNNNDFFPRHKSKKSSSSSLPMSKLSSHIFLYVSCIFVVIHMIYSMIWILLPVYFSAPLRSGGLGYNVKDLSFLFSCSSILCLQLFYCFYCKFDLLIKSSPVRALRIGCGIFFITSLALQWYIRSYTFLIEDALHQLHHLHHHQSHHSQPIITPGTSVGGISTVSSPSVSRALANPTELLSGNHHGLSSSTTSFGVDDVMVSATLDSLHHLATSPLLSSTATTIATSIQNRLFMLEQEINVLHVLSGILPSVSLTSLFIPSFLIALLISSLFVCRKASNLLLHLTLQTSFHSPILIQTSLTTIVEIAGPFLSTLLYSIVYSIHLRFPLDSSYFLSFSSSLILIAYMCSLFLMIQYRGDYGVMSDENEEIERRSIWEMISSWWSTRGGAGKEEKDADYWKENKTEDLQLNSNKLSSFGLQQRVQGNTRIDGTLSSTSNDNQQEKLRVGGTTAHRAIATGSLLSVPLGDCNLLFTSVASDYGSKIYNLKNDFKDV
jgi:hypothetical protein